MTAFVHRKYKIYIFYGVIICDKHDSIVNIKKGISDRHEAIEIGEIFWRENSPLTFHICDNIYPSQLNFFFFLIEFVFMTNMLTVVNSLFALKERMYTLKFGSKILFFFIATPSLLPPPFAKFRIWQQKI